MAAVALLPMYDLPEVRAANDTLWAAVASRLRKAGLRDVPDALSRQLGHHEGWRHPGLLFAQSCGYPAVHDFRAVLRIVAAPIHDAPGCSGATHCSFLLVAADSPAQGIADLRGLRFALNSWDSNTGMNLARLAFAPFARDGRFLGGIVETGGHAASLASLARGDSDAAAIDCVSYALLARHRPALADATRILARTAQSPTLPFVTASSQPAVDDNSAARRARRRVGGSRGRGVPRGAVAHGNGTRRQRRLWHPVRLPGQGGRIWAIPCSPRAGFRRRAA